MEDSSIADESRECLNEQEPKTKTGRFGEKADLWLLPNVFLRKPNWSGERTRLLERFPTKLKALGRRMLVQTPSSHAHQSLQHYVTRNNSFDFVYDVTREKCRVG